MYGADTVAAQMDLALGRPFNIRRERSGHGIIHVLTSPSGQEGVLIDIEGLDTVKSLPGVADAEVVIPTGGVVRPFTDSGNKLGYIVVTAGSPAEAEARLTRALGTLNLLVVPR